mgnify:CR=1 FL=1
MGNVYNDNDAVDTALAAGSESMGYTETGSGAGMDPEVSSALEAGNREADAEVDSAKDDADNTRKGSRDLADTDEENGSDLDGIGTELSAGEGGGVGAGGLGSPAGGMPAGGTPPMPQMSPMSMPQAPQMPQVPQGMYQMPAQMFKDLAGNMKPSSELSKGGKGSGSDISFGAGKPVGEDKIDVSKVSYDKTGLGVLTDSEIKATIDKALDLNGISDDPKVRGQWHEVLTFMADKESSRNPDAVNLTDSNAIGAPAADGHPGQSSRGIWQTIPTTFAGNHVSGTSTNIYDPVANAAAAVRYTMNRYDVDPSGGASLQKFYSNRMSGGYTGY